MFLPILIILAMAASMFGLATPAVAIANSVDVLLDVDPLSVCADGTLYYTVYVENDALGDWDAEVDLVFYPPGPAGGPTSFGAPVVLATDLYLAVGEAVTFTWVGGGGNYTNAALEVDLGAIPLDPCVDLVYGAVDYQADYITGGAPFGASGTKDVPATVEYGCISGYKYDDCTGLGLEGWTIELYELGGALVASTTTDIDGYYEFCGDPCLMPGDYTVCEIVEAGWMAVH
jgi:hypothetical protein